jgi:hypothetical protein
MTLLERIRSWFVRQEAVSAEQEEARLMERLRAQHRRLGRQLYWQGGASGWYRLLGKTPRVKMTLSAEAAVLTPQAQGLVRSRALAYVQLPWWKKLFSSKRRDYRLFLYLGSQRYLAATRESKPLVAAFRDDFLLVLRGSRYARHWHARFVADDAARLACSRLHAVQAPILQFKQRLEALSAELAASRVKAKRAKAWAEVASYTVAAAKSGDRSVPSPMMVSTQELGKRAMGCGKALLELSKQAAALVVEVNASGQPAVSRHPGVVSLQREVSRLAVGLDGCCKEAEQEGALALKTGRQVSCDSGDVAWGRAAKAKKAAEAMKAEADAARADAQEARRQRLQADRLLAQARQVAVQRLERRSLRLDEQERRIRGMTKMQRFREPSAWTEADIFMLRLGILQDAHRGGVFHLLSSSRVFNTVSPVFSSLFNPQRCSGDGSAAKENKEMRRG